MCKSYEKRRPKWERNQNLEKKDDLNFSKIKMSMKHKSTDFSTSVTQHTPHKKDEICGSQQLDANCCTNFLH